MYKAKPSPQKGLRSKLFKSPGFNVFAIFLIGMYCVFVATSMRMESFQIRADLDISGARLEFLRKVIGVAFALTAIIGGYVSDRWRRMKIVAITLIVLSFSITLTGYCRTYESLLMMRIVSGGCKGFIFPGLVAMLFDFVPRRLWNSAYAMFLLVSFVGAGMSSVFVGQILAKNDRYDIGLLKKAILKDGENELGGWKFNRIEELPHRKARFVFNNISGAKIRFELGALNESKEADIRSGLFNVTYKVKDNGGVSHEEIKRVIDAFRERLIDSEDKIVLRQHDYEGGAGAHFKMPVMRKEYKERFSFDPREGFVLHGVMTKRDSKYLRGLSHDKLYNSAVEDFYFKSIYRYKKTDAWRNFYRVYGPVGLVFALMALLLKEPSTGVRESCMVVADNFGNKYNVWGLFKTPVFALIIASGLISRIGINGINTWIYPYIWRYWHYGFYKAVVFQAPLIFASLLAIPFSGIFADALKRRYERFNLYFIVTVLLVGAMLFYLFILAGAKSVMVAGLYTHIILLACFDVPFMVFLLSKAPLHFRATTYGVYACFTIIVSDAISNVAIGLLSDRYGLKTALCFMPIFLIVGGVGFIVSGILMNRGSGVLPQTYAVDRKSGLD